MNRGKRQFMFENILVPLDGTALGEAALPYARALVAKTGASLTLVRAAHYASLLGNVAINQYRVVEQAEDYLRQQVDELAARGVHARAAVPYGGSAADWIV